MSPWCFGFDASGRLALFGTDGAPVRVSLQACLGLPEHAISLPPSIPISWVCALAMHVLYTWERPG